MGALTELVDKYNAENGYYIAASEYSKFRCDYEKVKLTYEDLIKICDVILLKYQNHKAIFDIEYNLKCFLGLKIKTYFIFYQWTFETELNDSVMKIKEICKRENGLSCIERVSTDDDFFMFRPVNHGPGIEIRDEKNRTPMEMNELFKDVYCRKKEFKRLTWGW